VPKRSLNYYEVKAGLKGVSDMQVVTALRGPDDNRNLRLLKLYTASVIRFWTGVDWGYISPLPFVVLPEFDSVIRCDHEHYRRHIFRAAAAIGLEVVRIPSSRIADLPVPPLGAGYSYTGWARGWIKICYGISGKIREHYDNQDS